MDLDAAPSRHKLAMRWMMALAYFAAGVLHIAIPAPFLTITPDWVPWPQQVIFLTGICEIFGSVGLLIPATRVYAGAALALYAICVFPANLKHAFGAPPPGAISLSWWYHGPRLALQPVLVWWALYCSGCITWPFVGQSRARARTGGFRAAATKPEGPPRDSACHGGQDGPTFQ